MCAQSKGVFFSLRKLVPHFGANGRPNGTTNETNTAANSRHGHQQVGQNLDLVNNTKAPQTMLPTHDGKVACSTQLGGNMIGSIRIGRVLKRPRKNIRVSSACVSKYPGEGKEQQSPITDEMPAQLMVSSVVQPLNIIGSRRSTSENHGRLSANGQIHSKFNDATRG